MKKTTYDRFMQWGMWLLCVLIVMAIAVKRDGRLLGHSMAWLQTEESDTEQQDTATVLHLADGSMVANTTCLGADVVGYAGPVPLKVIVREGRVDSIAVLENRETPDFLDCVKEELLPQYEGLTVQEAARLQVDAVSGATFTSNAVKANIRMALQLLQDEEQTAEVVGKDTETLDWVKLSLALLVALMAALLPLWVKNRTYRVVQLALNVGVLGFYTGTFVSFSSMVGVMSNGVSLAQLALLVLLAVAFVYPLFGRRNYYCTWCCPMGSAQDLMGRVRKQKWTLSPRPTKVLKHVRELLMVGLVISSGSAAFFDWMDYEAFSAFMWQTASWVVIAYTAVFLILSVFVTKPYCRFVCPTGTLMKAI